jgi:hypothetical protein
LIQKCDRPGEVWVFITSLLTTDFVVYLR